MAFNTTSWAQDLKITLNADDADSIVASGTYAAGYIPLNGALANKTVAQLPVVGSITLTSADDLSSVNFVISGKNSSGVEITETLAGPNANTVTSALNTYWRITSIVPSATSVSTVSAGISGDNDAISTLAAPSAGVSLSVVSGILASAEFILFPHPSFESITAAEDESANTFTFAGLDNLNNTANQSIVGPNATSINLKLPFSRISWISQDNAGSGAITVGNVAATYSPWCYHAKGQEGFNVEMGVHVPAGVAVDYTIQHALISAALGVEIIADDAFVANSTSDNTTYLFNEPFDASRVLVNYGTGPLNIYFLLRPAGLRGAENPNKGV